MKQDRSVLLSMLLLLASNQVATSSECLVPVKTIPLKGVMGKLDHLSVDSKGERLFVANKPNNTLDIVDLKTGTLVKQIPDQGKVSGVAYAADLDMIYVGNGSGTCNGFDGKDYHLVFSTKAPNADNVHFHSGNNMVYVGQDEIMSVLDAKTGDRKAEIQLPGAVHGFRIDKKAARIYAVLTKPNLLAVIDIEKNTVIEKLPLSEAGSPVAQAADSGLLFIGCPKNKPMVIVFDIKTGKEISSVSIPGGVDDVYFDSKRNRLYASTSENALVVIGKVGEEFKIVQKLEVPKDSRTCVWSKGKLYLGVPKSDSTEGPEVRIYDAHPITIEQTSTAP